MAALAKEDWLHIAQRLSVGQQMRVHHGHERRPNMTVKNTYDKYVAYCQACKMGGVVEKTHVRITGVQAPQASNLLTLPDDMVRVVDAPEALQRGVLGFLAVKNMDPVYLPELYFSESRKRLMLQTPEGWMGRDTTESSPQKWLTYNGQTHLAWKRFEAVDNIAVVTEDAFSFFKVRWAAEAIDIDVYSSLGTRFSDTLVLKLLQYKKVVVFYDGDEAGRKGADKEAKRMRAMGVQADAACAPEGKDPKDMLIEDIRFWLVGR